MATWRDDKILELASQLTYSNAEKRHEQLSAAIALVGSVDPAKTYPWDFIHFRITGFQPVTHSDHAVAGKILRTDLSTLIEFLSDTLSIDVADAVAPHSDDRVLTMEEVSAQFKVASKTIQRWRKTGLIALRYVYPDGRRRLGFLDSVIAEFASVNKDRVERSATFKQLSEEEKAKILTMARRFSGCTGATLKEISERIGRRIHRSTEAVRYALRRHDHDHPEAALFTPDGHPAPAPAADRAAIVDSFNTGTPVETLAARFRRTQASIARIIAQDRAATLKSTRIEYLHNPLFDHPEAETIILTVLPAEALAKAQASVAAGNNAKAADVYMARTPQDLPAFLQEVFRQPVIPQELEIDAFRRMNFLKFKAAALQSRLDTQNANPADVAAIDSLLTQAHDIKNLLVQSNLRVAVHVARKHQRPDRPLIELFSDATIWLMRSIDTFDFSRNTRFTTYAGYAIMKNFARNRAEQLTRRDRHLVTGQEEALDAVASPAAAHVSDTLDAAALQQELLTVMNQLPARERELITRHYGLGEQQNQWSLSEIGTHMGITKARVRQLEAKALRKLRHLLDTRRENLHDATLKA
jgi:RNA polymerase sigma factor (sigma-70 family)